MEDAFKKFIQKITPITDKEFEESILGLKRRTLKKGELFIQQGKVCKEIAFIYEGILRNYYSNEKGEEITACFCTKNSLTTSYKSFLLQESSNNSIVALEETELLVISYHQIQELYSKNPIWQTIGRLVAEKEFIEMEQYATIMKNETAKEKYLRLLEEQPEILQKVPITYIASYLGVTRRTLSRIRKETML